MRKIFIAITGCLMLAAVSAQTSVDRTKMPKPGPAPVITFKDPATYKLSNGITVLVVENHTLPKVSANYFIDRGPIVEGDKAGVISLMGQMLNEGTTSMTKAEFDEAVDQMGAEVFLGSGSGSASALTRYFEKAFMLMTDALKNPAFPRESFDKLKSQTLTALKADEKNAKAISANVVSALSYGVDHPMGEFQTEATTNNITLEDVKEAYKKYVTSSRGYLTFVGDITPQKAKELAEKALGNWKGASLSMPALKTVSNPGKTEINIVDVPNAVQSEITVTNLVSLPLSSPDYFAVLLANNILGGGSEARLFMNLRERHGFTYGCYSSVGSGRFQSRFSASASVRNDKTDSAVAEILHEIDTMRIKKVTEEELKNAKALYNGSFALGMENPARTASYASNILINGLPKDFYRTYLQRINAVTADDILRVSKKYFNYDNTRIVVVGKQEQILPALKALGHPVKFYDKNALPVEENANAAKQTNVTAAQVLDNYVRAIGGKDALGKVKAIVGTGKMEAMGTSLAVTIKGAAPNKSMMAVSMGGQAVMKEVFDGSTGYQMQMGQKEDLEADDIKDKQAVKGLFPQLYYGENGYKAEVTGIEKVGDADAYVLKITKPSGKIKTEYYDAKSNLLIKESEVLDAGGTAVTQSTSLSDYRKVGDVMMPYKLTIGVDTPAGTQEFAITLDEIKLNEPVAEEDFK